MVAYRRPIRFWEWGSFIAELLTAKGWIFFLQVVVARSIARPKLNRITLCLTMFTHLKKEVVVVEITVHCIFTQ